ncbi:hypothetical protein VFPPC_15664 [Pochonia chlamydosporia 170]|uniref:Uncharacterized protein n=1 Tax=Pochonia chlamydosporia 170 TaxID=1380566 RepID=A0A179G1U0_METCM|nr:hypothetical protein VFPPC_15664 [Pochonia chlamydosporia 170]OAQ71199.1 hypothetical protein VFPPC_15664 [Pochonia chlamydosporia 170]
MQRDAKFAGSMYSTQEYRRVGSFRCHPDQLLPSNVMPSHARSCPVMSLRASLAATKSSQNSTLPWVVRYRYLGTYLGGHAACGRERGLAQALLDDSHRPLNPEKSIHSLQASPPLCPKSEPALRYHPLIFPPLLLFCWVSSDVYTRPSLLKSLVFSITFQFPSLPRLRHTCVSYKITNIPPSPPTSVAVIRDRSN